MPLKHGAKGLPATSPSASWRSDTCEVACAGLTPCPITTFLSENSHRLLYWMRKRRDKLGYELGAPASDLRQQEVSLDSCVEYGVNPMY